jgi:hypothetical protein
MRNEARFRMAEMTDPARFKKLLERASAHTARRVAIYQQLAGIRVGADSEEPAGGPARRG